MPNIYNSGANYSYSVSPSAGSPVASTNTTRRGAAPLVDSSYIPPGQRVANFGNVFNPANANAMDYSLYSNYYSPYPTKGLGGLVADEHARLQMLGPEEYYRQGRIGMPTTGPGWDPNFNDVTARMNAQRSAGGPQFGIASTPQSFLQNYDQNLANIQQRIAQGTMAWAQPPQGVANTEADRLAALQNPWWLTSSGNP